MKGSLGILNREVMARWWPLTVLCLSGRTNAGGSAGEKPWNCTGWYPGGVVEEVWTAGTQLENRQGWVGNSWKGGQSPRIWGW